jgi:hypothetical protein
VSDIPLQMRHQHHSYFTLLCRRHYYFNTFRFYQFCNVFQPMILMHVIWSSCLDFAGAHHNFALCWGTLSVTIRLLGCGLNINLINVKKYISISSWCSRVDLYWQTNKPPSVNSMSLPMWTISLPPDFPCSFLSGQWKGLIRRFVFYSV